MEPKLLTKDGWEKAAKNFNFNDNRVQNKLADFEGMKEDAYQERITCLSEVRHLAKLLPDETKDAARFLAGFLQTVDKEQARLVKAKKAAKAQAGETFTPQEAANLIRKIKFSGLIWDPKKPQQAHPAIDKAIKACRWKAYTHFAKNVLKRGPKRKIHNGDDLQEAIRAGRSEPHKEGEGKFIHRIAHGGYISYNPSVPIIITLV